MKEEVSPIPACASNILDLIKTNIRVKGIYAVGSYRKLNSIYSHTCTLLMSYLVGVHEIEREWNEISIILWVIVHNYYSIPFVANSNPPTCARMLHPTHLPHKLSLVSQATAPCIG